MTQFTIIFIGVMFSGEAAADFFSNTTSLTKAAAACNYIFWLRRLEPIVQEDLSKPPFDGEEKGPTHIIAQDVTYAYESRPYINVLEGINIGVSKESPNRCSSFLNDHL
jgi:ATP-binding cassette subfamily B (MDR/TAP) protein 1